MSDTETDTIADTTVKFTDEEYKNLETQLNRAKEDSKEIEQAFHESLTDDMRELIPADLNLKQKIILTNKLKDRFKVFGKNTGPDEPAPKRKPTMPDISGLSGMDLLRAGLSQPQK